ncbi:MAG: hypothetical protein LBV31_01840 [Prevotellaceae bacterium]|jgi:hypothetical protein|nr:hypothetical protein [Prevotellaceae bacterium]
MKKTVILASLFFVFSGSCKKRNTVNGDDANVSSSVAIQIEQNTSADFHETRKLEVPEEDINLSKTFDKLRYKKKLENDDYIIINKFLLTNTDESQSEELGYLLYEYLRNDAAKNTDYLDFLENQSIANKDSILCLLIQSMCIDLGEDDYNYEKLIKDFCIFKGNTLAQKKLNECINNQ